MRLSRSAALLTAALLIPGAAAAADSARESGRRAARPALSGTTSLTAAEQDTALQVARADIEAAGLVTDDRLYVVSIHWFHDKNSKDRQALVTHYRTEGDLTIRQRVNVSRGTVEHRTVLAHSPTGLSQEEFEIARGLALADANVRKALGQRALADVVVEPMVVHGMPEGADDHGHRVVRMLFKVGSDYLHRPVVFVDLTDGLVRIEDKDPDGPQ